ncbi:retinoid-binding protein 7 isoform X1 [Lemur catta]|uniref:retinoid-binding protein 7 isoform X1 n=1 Tax=Lemur catta TaxID=9447 RepID=UPI001E26A430|nr:retinoid-binding protein 7 isoform X1 [Lemur catta]
MRFKAVPWSLTRTQRNKRGPEQRGVRGCSESDWQRREPQGRGPAAPRSGQRRPEGGSRERPRPARAPFKPQGGGRASRPPAGECRQTRDHARRPQRHLEPALQRQLRGLHAGPSFCQTAGRRKATCPLDKDELTWRSWPAIGEFLVHPPVARETQGAVLQAGRSPV